MLNRLHLAAILPLLSAIAPVDDPLECPGCEDETVAWNVPADYSYCETHGIWPFQDTYCFIVTWAVDVTPNDGRCWIPVEPDDCVEEYPCTPFVSVTGIADRTDNGVDPTTGWGAIAVRPYGSICNSTAADGTIIYFPDGDPVTVFSDYVGVNCGESCVSSLGAGVTSYWPTAIGQPGNPLGLEFVDFPGTLSCDGCGGPQ